MSISDVSNIFGVIGGLGMFLFGMHQMSDGMQQTAGGRMNRLLGMLTNNRLMSVILGTVITVIIQSSGATTVMVVGFVGAGVMNLSQAVGIIMGANIGTTITGWVVSLSQLGSAMTVLKPIFYAPLMIGIGSVLILFLKKQSDHIAGQILVGLGLLFMGLDMMSSSISGYTDAPIFGKAFTLLGDNPFLGILIGIAVTLILQSSSASVGILQTLAMSGVVTASAAVYIALGENIGACSTAMISSVGGSRDAKRAAAINLIFNIIGAALCVAAAFIFFAVNPAIASGKVAAVQIAIFHTGYNIVKTIVQYPFADQIVKLSGLLVKEKADETEKSEEDDEEALTLRHLDERIFRSPAFAVETASLEIQHMGQITMKNVRHSIDAILTGNLDEIEEVYQIEKTIDKMAQMLTEYMIKIENLSLTEHQKLVVNNLFYSVSDIERVGDHAENLADLAKYMVEHKLDFSETGDNDLREISGPVFKSFEYAIEARRTGNMDAVRKVSQYEDEVDNLEEELREKHIERLSRGECVPSSGIVFLDILTNLERISDHAYNLAGYVKNEM